MDLKDLRLNKTCGQLLRVNPRPGTSIVSLPVKLIKRALNR